MSSYEFNKVFNNRFPTFVRHYPEYTEIVQNDITELRPVLQKVLEDKKDYSRLIMALRVEFDIFEISRYVKRTIGNNIISYNSG